mgnify:CR=1 FL=1
MPQNVEIKCHCEDLDRVRAILLQNNIAFVSAERQVDTYFRTPHGRLKLREGEIDNHLIHYMRDDDAGPSHSEVLLFEATPGSNLKTILSNALGVLILVEKRREIWRSDNVKIHLDEVKHLGNFLEIEAIDQTERIGKNRLRKQCEHFIRLLQLDVQSLVPQSYSDLLLQQNAE